MNRVHPVVVGLAALLGGCFGNEVTEFPEGLEPLGESTAMGPGTAAEPFPEDFELLLAQSARFDVLHGRGYIHAPINDVWNAYRDPAVGADRRTSPGWSSMPVDDPMYDDSYIVSHIAENIVTVEWDVTWRHGIVEGTEEAPELIAIRWQKTNGSTLISRINGSILLRPVNEGAYTEVELVYHASAAESGTDTYMQYMMDVYNDAVAVAHGDPLPTFD